jgi:hypothetical protein
MAELIIGIVLALLIILAIAVIAGLILRRRRHPQAHAGSWQSRALDACAAADALRDRVETRLMRVRSGAPDERAPGNRWSDTERDLEQLATMLHALRFGAPTYTAGQATQEVLMAVTALRSALPVTDGARAGSTAFAGEPVGTAEARLMELDAAVRALRSAI